MSRRRLGLEFVSAVALLAQICAAQAQLRPTLPPRAAQAQRFLAHRGLRPGLAPAHRAQPRTQSLPARPQFAAGAAVWQPLGPVSVTTPNYGPVSGRISAIAFDPTDATGNTLYIGTTGGGVWSTNNAAADPSYILFTPLTDSVGALNGALDPSISIGAVTVQPANNQILLAGTGDPNDALDSYYGAGILRSTDGGATWSLIQQSSDVEQGSGLYDFGFYGLGFAGFAWSDKDPRTVVAAVSEAYESLHVGVQWPASRSAGLYYSTDSGATWQLATITDLNGQVVQGPMQPSAASEGNPATAVVWNPVRKLFLAAIRYHGYYSSPDGINWTQLSAQPGPGFTTQNCPTNAGQLGSPACPIFRGAFAVNPSTGDTFAWSVDIANQDQGIWQDLCAQSKGGCSNANVTFGVQLTDGPLESNQPGQGPATILNGDYNLALAAIPSGDDTLLLAGANDLWKCDVAPPAGAPAASVYCSWHNTTNAFTCPASAGVAPYQHVLAWNQGNSVVPGNPLQIFTGNDSGLWRSMDGIAESGSTCDSTDADHFQNLNASLGSLAEVESLAAAPATPYTMLAGLGVNGTAGVKNTTAPISQWPQILSGQGGPVVIDPSSPNDWYVNNGAGVSIHRCSQSAPCTQADFGWTIFGDSDPVSQDSLVMTEPAPFLIDPADSSQILIATCRLWRGTKTDGSGWTASNAVTPMLGSGSSSQACSGNPLIRTFAALKLPNGGEVVYAGTYGHCPQCYIDNGGTLPGHVFQAVMSPDGTWSPFNDLTVAYPVVNDNQSMNAYNLDISSIFIDPADTSGNTVYVTVEGIPSASQPVRTLYSLLSDGNGGYTWQDLNSNLPAAPANSVVVDPSDPSTVYVATDAGVYITRQIASCAASGSACWAPMGSGLPMSPVVTLAAMPPGGNPPTLIAGTYGRGVWQIPLITAGELPTSAAIAPLKLNFPDQPVNSLGNPLDLTVTNTGGVGLSITAVTIDGANPGDFTETDNCSGQEIVASSTCTIQVYFAPTKTGARSAQITVAGNLAAGSLTATLSGNGTPAASVTITPPALSFGSVPVNSQSAPLPLTVGNSGTDAVTITSLVPTGPFQLVDNSCTANNSTLAANSSCSLTVAFAPTATGQATGSLTLTDSEGTHTVQLSGSGTAPPTDTLSPASLSFPDTIVSQPSAAQAVSLANTGQNPLTNIALSTTGPFQETDNCTTQLAAQSTCFISVVFLPTAAGPATGALVLTDILLSKTAKTVPLTGTGLTPPQITASPTYLAFKDVAVNTTSAAQTVTITNTGGAPMSNVVFSIAGDPDKTFSVTPALCQASLAVGASCTGKVTFAPVSPDGINVTATLAISSSTRGVTPASVPLLGNNGKPGTGLKLTPASIQFAPTGVGASSASATVTLTNISPIQDLNDLTVTTSAGFTVTANPCGSSLKANSSCAVAVAFTPSVQGPQTGTLSVASSSLITPVTAALAGTGFDFTLTGSNTVTVTSGQTAIFTFKLADLVNVPGKFSFQCGGITPTAQYAACVFTPQTTTISANGSGTQTLDVTTSATSAARVAASSHGPSRAWLLACGLLLLPIALRKRRNLLLLVAGLAIVTSAISSCAGASGKKSGGGGGGITTNTTPPGTYTIPVWAMANGVPAVNAPCDAAARQNGAQRCINLTMIVE